MKATKTRNHEKDFLGSDFVFSCFRGPSFRAFVAILVAVTMLAAGESGAVAQEKAPKYPIFTAEHLDEAMKTIGLAFTLTRSAIDKNSPENAKDYLIRARDQLATTITYWRDRKNEAAIATLRETLKKMDALDQAMSTETVDIKAAAALAGSVGESCEACHAKYREQDPTTRAYRVKPDVR
jgi:cytochrome c556